MKCLSLLFIAYSVFCASLTAFDITLKGVEFGSLTYQSNDAVDTVYPDNTRLFSNALTLEEGDVLQILRTNYGDVRWRLENLVTNDWTNASIYPKVYFSRSSLQDTLLTASTSSSDAYIVGPAVVQVGFLLLSSSNISGNQAEGWQFKKMGLNNYITMDYAILRASSSSHSTSIPVNTVVIPTNANGDVEIILESSVDLVNWTAATPGQYSAATENRFFRIRAVETGN